MPQTMQEIMQERDVTPGEAKAIRDQQVQDEKDAIIKPLKEAAELAAKKRKEDREADERAKAKAFEDRKDAAIKAEALRAFVDSGGNAADFERVWPTLRDDVIKQKTMQALSNTQRRANMPYL